MKKDLVRVGNTALAVRRSLTPGQYDGLAEVPPELEWLANLTNPRTRSAYKIDVGEFAAFAGHHSPNDMRTVAPCPCHHLAQGPGIPWPLARQPPAQALGTLISV